MSISIWFFNYFDLFSWFSIFIFCSFSVISFLYQFTFPFLSIFLPFLISYFCSFYIFSKLFWLPYLTHFFFFFSNNLFLPTIRKITRSTTGNGLIRKVAKRVRFGIGIIGYILRIIIIVETRLMMMSRGVT